MNRFAKGYEYDAGIDIILDKDVVLKARDTTVIDTKLQVTPCLGECAIIVPRSSAAIKGINTAHCPIDTDYVGNVHIVAYNLSDKDIEYKAGESFCQVVFLELGLPTIEYEIKKEGRRSYGMFGSTDTTNKDMR